MKNGSYGEAYEEVFFKTSPHAPWFIIPQTRKWARNLLIARIIAATLDALHLTYPQVDFNTNDIKIP